ncbi:response regulator [Haloplanus halophilus]|uniref:response regulator n=1 Tax=Haloplanus halophilus TaxID=2949993 RepID=UPI0020424761|nr:response regulator [Haloplanus sp. GDY1]
MREATPLSGTVVIAEDEPGLVDLYRTWLSDRHEVRTAADGREAIDRMDGDVDVALLDRRLPRRSGDDVLEWIRAHEDCRVAMVTCVAPHPDDDLPADAYLTKPVFRETLAETVIDLLLRGRTDEDTRTLLALVSRKLALEESYAAPELDSHPGYAALETRIDRRLDRLGAELRTAASRHGIEACPECGRRRGDAERVGVVELGPAAVKCLGCGAVVRAADPSEGSDAA